MVGDVILHFLFFSRTVLSCGWDWACGEKIWAQNLTKKQIRHRKAGLVVCALVVLAALIFKLLSGSK